MSCLFCEEQSYKKSYLPSTYFNSKIFDYRKCMSCDLVYIHPLPLNEDYLKMYPPSYQEGIDAHIHKNPELKLHGLRYSYTYHWKLIDQYSPHGSILDYGCGSANFLINSINNGYSCDGAEYNLDHVKILKQGIPNANFFSIQEILDLTIEKKYDVIRLSNVFEHLNNPKEVISKLKSHLNKKGIILVEGPLEENFNLAWLFRKLYFRIKKIITNNRLESHSPTHIIFTNVQNQKMFFEQMGFETLHYDISESEWPFPSIELVKTKGDRLKNLIARVSIWVSNKNKNWGNTFIYVGRK